MRLSLRRLDSVKGTLERNIIFKRFVLAQVNKCSEGFYGRRNESSTATRTGNIQVIVFVVKLIFLLDRGYTGNPVLQTECDHRLQLLLAVLV